LLIWPKTLAQIDGVFVTVEPDGGTQKPAVILFFSPISELTRINREQNVVPENGNSSAECLRLASSPWARM